MNLVVDVCCKDREKFLRIGFVKINVGNIEIVLGDVFKLVLFLYNKILRILWEFGYIVDKYVICYELVF